jgi:hypothetical protein
MWTSCRTRAAHVIVLAALAAAVPAQLVAQDPDGGDTTSLATYGARDRAAFARGVTGDEYIRALRSIQSCDVIAGEVLAREWQTPPTDSATVMLLGAISANVRDQRLYESVRRVAMSGSAATVVRLAAIAALVAYADSTVRLQYFAPPADAVTAHPGVGIGHLTHMISVARPGKPLSPSVRSDVIATLTTLGEHDANERVRRVAAYVARRIKSGMY